MPYAALSAYAPIVHTCLVEYPLTESRHWDCSSTYITGQVTLSAFQLFTMSLASEFLEHYIDYLSAPGILVTLLLVIAPLCYGAYQDKPYSSSDSRTSRIPGCRRFGLSAGQSNLKDQFNHEPSTDSERTAKVKALFTYPIKSCHGVELPASEVDHTGLRYDRMFTFAQLHSKQPNAEEAHETTTDSTLR